MSRVLITGADGHIGRAAAAWFAEKSDDELLLFVRAGDASELDSKIRRIGNLADSGRCVVVGGDLRDDKPFASIDTGPVARIIHCAAVTSFAVDRETAQSVNIDGTAKVLEFAERCPNLQAFCFVSSLYAAGLRSGRIGEQPLDDAGEYANHYEWSKWRAECAVQEAADLPWQIVRVATILAEDESGTVQQQNVIHNTLRLLFYGLLSVIPGNPGTRVYSASTDYTIESIGRAAMHGEPGGIYHVSDSGDDALTLGELTDTVYDRFREDESFSRQGILKPLFCDHDAFTTLVDGVGAFGGAVSQALSSVVPFAPQLYSDKHFETVRTQSLLDGRKSPSPAAMANAVARYLVTTRWNRNPKE